MEVLPWFVDFDIVQAAAKFKVVPLEFGDATSKMGKCVLHCSC
jgi:hypothetical protein